MQHVLINRRRLTLGCALIALASAATAKADEAVDGSITVTGEREAYKVDETSTATKLPMSLRETPQAVTVITRQQMEDFNLNTIADVLAQTPGITISSTDSNRTNFFSRGFAIRNFQIDGVPTIFQTSAYANSALSDMSIYERVEVIRGATGLGAGTGDPSGIVNLVRKSPTAEFGASVNLTGGNWDHFRIEADVTGPLTSDGAIRARAVAAYTNKQSFVDFQHDKSPSLYGVIEADLSPDTTIRVGADYLETTSDGAAWGTVPLFFSDGTRTNLPRSYSAAARWNVWNRKMLNVFGRVDQNLGGDWQARLSYNYRTLDSESLLFAGSAGFPNRDGTGMGVWNFYGSNAQKEHAFDAYLSGPVQLFGRTHEVVLGANHYKREFDVFYGGIVGDYPAFGNIFTWDGNTPKSDYFRTTRPDWTDHARETGVYGAIRLNPADGVKLIVGGRYTDAQNYTDNFSSDGAFENQTNRVTGKKFSPYGGLIVDLTDSISMFASYATVFKPQSLRTQNLDQLPPVTGENYEGGFKAEFFDKKLYVAATGFHMKQNNIGQVDNTLPEPAPGQETFYVATPGVKTWGGEFEVTGQVAKGWNLFGGYTYSRSHNDEGRQFFTQPLHLARFNSTYTFSGQLRDLTVGGGLSWQSGIYQIAAIPTGAFNGTAPVTSRQRVDQKGYALVNLMARYAVSENIQIGANITNLLDKVYFRNVGANGFYGEPRKVMVNARMSFR